MNTQTIVGYVTQPNGSPVSGAEIWISSPVASGGEAESKFAARTDARGYFRLNLADGRTNVVEIGDRLKVSVGGRKDGRTNFKDGVASRYELTGYLIRETSGVENSAAPQ